MLIASSYVKAESPKELTSHWGPKAKTINIINNKTFKIGGYYVTSNEFKELVSYRVR